MNEVIRQGCWSFKRLHVVTKCLLRPLLNIKFLSPQAPFTWQLRKWNYPERDASLDTLLLDFCFFPCFEIFASLGWPRKSQLNASRCVGHD